MREIKFRAWDGKQMYCFDLPTYMSLTENVQEDECPCSARNTLMQYTGLHDKNGKEIYESDIVKWNDTIYKVCIGEFGVRNFETEQVLDMTVGVYCEPIHEKIEPFCYQLQLNTAWIKYHDIEVIGNIYENPDLIK